MGVVNEKIEKKTERLNLFEILTYSTLAIVILIFGIKPNLILDYTSSSLEKDYKIVSYINFLKDYFCDLYS